MSNVLMRCKHTYVFRRYELLKAEALDESIDLNKLSPTLKPIENRWEDLSLDEQNEFDDEIKYKPWIDKCDDKCHKRREERQR